ncbi:MAG: hypothetical protein HOF21_04520 [Nitrospina sp.]|jgi:hypothetical protein|nr:hypothetical protein [Nitrospina sp.]MBT5633739.1 hypothetical protein [Nitrospina sp.]
MNQKNTKIIKLLKHKQETCAQLLLKMEEQMEAVNKEDDSQLKKIIEVKEGLIATLNEADQKIADLVRDLDETARESLARENKDLGHRIENDLEKIIEQEIVCQEKLNLVKNEVVEKIKGLRKGQELLKGYERSQRIKPKISRNV